MIGRAVSMAMAKPMFWASCDGGVDADDLAGELEQRAAGVAGVDRGVGLHEVGEVLAVAGVDRPVEADTMPSVTVGPPVRSRALPMATTCSPIWRSDDLPSGSAVRPVLSTFRTARSSVRSTARTVAGAVEPSGKLTVMLVASAMTWALVTMWPSLLITNPVPAP